MILIEVSGLSTVQGRTGNGGCDEDSRRKLPMIKVVEEYQESGQRGLQNFCNNYLRPSIAVEIGRRLTVAAIRRH
jgi:hypothetical protein